MESVLDITLDLTFGNILAFHCANAYYQHFCIDGDLYSFDESQREEEVLSSIKIVLHCNPTMSIMNRMEILW